MTEKSYKRIILHYLKDFRDFPHTNDGWIQAGMLRSIQTPYGFVGFRGDRDCRDLVKMGLLERRIRNGLAEVRYIPPVPQTREEESKQLVLEATR